VPSISSPLRSEPLPPVFAEDEQEYKSFTVLPTEDPFVTSSNHVAARSSNNTDNISPALPLHPPHVKIHRKPISISPHASPVRKSVRRDSRTLTSFPCADRKSLVTSAQSTFFTLGRDEMERKKGNLDNFADEGPFGRAKNLQGLEERRKKVEGGEKTATLGERNRTERDKGAGCRCLVM